VSAGLLLLSAVAQLLRLVVRASPEPVTARKSRRDHGSGEFRSSGLDDFFMTITGNSAGS